MKLFCKIFGHTLKDIEDKKIGGNIVVTDSLKANQFKFPVVVHREKCTVCGEIIESHPDLPGSCGGKYKVHYI